MNSAVLVQLKRAANLRKWGVQNWPDGTGPSERNVRRRDAQQKETSAKQAMGTVTRLDILKEEFREVACEADEEKLLAELLDVAAVALDWADDVLQRHQVKINAMEEKMGEPPARTCAVDGEA